MLLVILVFALLLTASVASFTRRAVIDAMIARNREASARAEALARGGARLAAAFLIHDRLWEESSALAPPGDSHLDRWHRIQQTEIDVGDGARLRLTIGDSGARLNLNALFTMGEDGGASALHDTEEFLMAFLEKVIDGIDLPPAEKFYDPRELSANFIDFIDGDDAGALGGHEDDLYQSQSAPYRAANRPLMSIDELRMIQGFDATLVEAIRPYVTVHPFVGGAGINLNTAPPHVLSLLYFDDGVSLRFVKEDTIRAILEAREGGNLVCTEGQNFDLCTPISDLMTNANTIFPPPTTRSNAFTVVSEARVGEIRRRIEAAFDRTNPMEPIWLSWRTR